MGVIFAVLGIWRGSSRCLGKEELRIKKLLLLLVNSSLNYWGELLINRLSYCSQVFWISNQNLGTYMCWFMSPYHHFCSSFSRVWDFSVFFCSEEDNTGGLKMCLSSEVISSFPKSRRFWGEQQMLQDVKESHGKAGRTLHGSAEVGRLDSTVGLDPVLPGMWTSHHVHKYLSHFCISIILKL